MLPTLTMLTMLRNAIFFVEKKQGRFFQIRKNADRKIVLMEKSLKKSGAFFPEQKKRHRKKYSWQNKIVVVAFFLIQKKRPGAFSNIEKTPGQFRQSAFARAFFLTFHFIHSLIYEFNRMDLTHWCCIFFIYNCKIYIGIYLGYLPTRQ